MHRVSAHMIYNLRVCEANLNKNEIKAGNENNVSVGNNKTYFPT